MLSITTRVKFVGIYQQFHGMSFWDSFPKISQKTRATASFLVKRVILAKMSTTEPADKKLMISILENQILHIISVSQLISYYLALSSFGKHVFQQEKKSTKNNQRMGETWSRVVQRE